MFFHFTGEQSEEKIYYERTEARTGSTLLFVHGMGGSVETWAPIRVYFQNQDCIFIDLPGHGRSDGVVRSVSDTADVISRFVKSFNDIQHLVYVGISFGSSVGLEFAARYPEMVNELILMSPRLQFHKTESEIEALVESVQNGSFVEQGSGPLLSDSMKRGLQRGMSKTSSKTIRDVFWKYNGYDISVNVDRIHARTLLLTGKYDGISDLSDAVFLRNSLSSVQMVELDTGHFIPIENSRETVRAMKQFLY